MIVCILKRIKAYGRDTFFVCSKLPITRAPVTELKYEACHVVDAEHGRMPRAKRGNLIKSNDCQTQTVGVGIECWCPARVRERKTFKYFCAIRLRKTVVSPR